MSAHGNGMKARARVPSAFMEPDRLKDLEGDLSRALPPGELPAAAASLAITLGCFSASAANSFLKALTLFTL